ncbi:MAG: hypothetical protein OEZ22_08285 [Spirochaetia bacterium]|nr:hypothetical protein [Spirochaetia bacterium]
MKIRNKIIILLLLSFTTPVLAVNYEADLSAGLSKRFLDTFDKRWEKMISSAEHEGIEYDLKGKSYLRSMGFSNISLYFSPFFRHYFGFSFAALLPYEKPIIIKEINNVEYSWLFDISLMSPVFSYKFFPFADNLDDETFYLSAEAGVALCEINLKQNSSGQEQLYTFKNIIAPRFVLKSGTKFDITNYIKIFVEAGFDVTRMDDIEGQTTINGKESLVTLKYSNDALIPADETQSYDYSSYDNAVIWLSQFFIGFGISFVY